MATRWMPKWEGKALHARSGRVGMGSPELVDGLLQLAEGLTSLESFEERLAHLCRVTCALLRCDRASVFLLDGKYYRAHSNFGNPPDIARVFHRHRVRLDDPLIRRAVEEKSFVIVNETQTDPLMNARTARAARIRAMVVAPLLQVDGGPLGFVTAEYNEHPGRFSELDSTLLLGVAKLAQAAVRMEGVEARRVQAEQEASELQRRILALERLEAIGRLSGGVAHDFNNILTVILGHCEFLSEDSQTSSSQGESIEAIRKSAERAGTLTRQLLAFGRRQILKPRVIDLDEVIEDMLPMLERLIPENIEISFSGRPDLGAVRADRAQIEQVLMNLALNARDAMPRGGRLTIETANAELDADYTRERPGARPGPYVMLAVSDTGEGIAPEALELVFEPFFTTKPVGEGSGLGLATVYGIVKQSGGNVWAYSEPGKGATFKVYLPWVSEAVEVLTPAPEPATLGGSETILLADDDQSLRALAQVALESRGYTVLAGCGAEEILALSRAHAGPIALLLTDVVMPRTSGLDLAKAVLRERPDVRVLYFSGYAENSIVHHGVLDAEVAFLSKPFTPRTLCAKVRAVLDGA